MKTALYRIFNKKGDLLYVGISFHPMVRLTQHFHNKSWLHDIASVEIEWHPNRDVARVAEGIAIEKEKAIHNIMRPISKHELLPTTTMRGNKLVKYELSLMLGSDIVDIIYEIRQNRKISTKETIDDIMFIFFKNFDLYKRFASEHKKPKNKRIMTHVPINNDIFLKIKHFQDTQPCHLEVVETLFRMYAACEYEIP